MNVPWAKLYLDENELKAVVDVLKSTWLSMGPKVQEFEEMMAHYVGVKHTIAVSSGTAALDIALKVLGIGQNDEVIVPAIVAPITRLSRLVKNGSELIAISLRVG